MYVVATLLRAPEIRRSTPSAMIFLSSLTYLSLMQTENSAPNKEPRSCTKFDSAKSGFHYS